MDGSASPHLQLLEQTRSTMQEWLDKVSQASAEGAITLQSDDEPSARRGPSDWQPPPASNTPCAVSARRASTTPGATRASEHAVS